MSGAYEVLLSVAVVVMVLMAINKEERAKELRNHLCQKKAVALQEFAVPSVCQGKIICNKESHNL